MALARANANFGAEPFLVACLKAVQLFLYKEVRDRARIPVYKGVTVIGIVDETRSLQRDEVFLSVSRNEGEDKFIVMVGHWEDL